jgi:hypothetical protein
MFSPSTSGSPTNFHSTNCSTVAIIYHLGLAQQASSGRSTKWTQSHPAKNNNNKTIPATSYLIGQCQHIPLSISLSIIFSYKLTLDQEQN